MKLVLVVLVFGIVCQARHIHPVNFDPNQLILDKLEKEEVDVAIDLIRNLKPTRFVPINSISFFKTLEPCEDGYKRDKLGVCREVWD